MLRHLAAKRLLPQSAVIAPFRRTLVARPVVCSWSKRDEVVSNWEALRANPGEWFDNRSRKSNPRAPDFVRKDNRSVAIWIDGRDNPEWADEVLEELDARQASRGDRGDRYGGDRGDRGDRYGGDRGDRGDRYSNDRGDRYSNDRGDRAGGDRNDRRAAEQANWEALRSNPEEWFDNRSRKTNPKAPDFRRRDDRSVALWLDSYGAPDWVGDLLQELDARRAERTAAYQQQQAPQEYNEEKWAADKAKWDMLRANPELWFDNRRSKTNPKAPDFKLKEDRTVALWLTSYQLPDYLDELLAELDARYEQRMNGQQQYQQQQQEYQAYPQEQQQDYQQQADGELAKWESLRENPEQWFDNRYSKTNPKWPDFRRKDDRTVTLWLTSRSAPEWVGDLMQELDARQQQRAAGRAAANYAPEGVY